MTQSTQKKRHYKLRADEVAHFLSRCVPAADCLEWVGANKSGAPVAAIKRHGKWHTLNLRPAFARHAGLDVSLQQRTVMTCGNAACLNVAHMQLQTMPRIVKTAYKRSKGGAWLNLARRAKLAEHARQRFGKLSEAAVADIRTKAEPVAAYMARYGVSKTTVCDIRRGHTHRMGLEKGNPWAGLFSGLVR